MPYLYYTCNWVFDIFDLFEIDLYLTLHIILSTGCELVCMTGENGRTDGLTENGSEYWTLGLRARSEESFEKFKQHVATKHHATDWLPVNGEVFEARRKIEVSGAQREWALAAFEGCRQVKENCYLLHRKFRDKWQNYVIMKTDWVITTDGLDHVFGMFKVADKYNGEMICSKLTTRNGYRFLRFIVILETFDKFESFRNEAVWPQQTWVPILRSDIPNVFTHNPAYASAANITSRFGEALLASAIYNRELKKKQ